MKSSCCGAEIVEHNGRRICNICAVACDSFNNLSVTVRSPAQCPSCDTLRKELEREKRLYDLLLKECAATGRELGELRVKVRDLLSSHHDQWESLTIELRDLVKEGK